MKSSICLSVLLLFTLLFVSTSCNKDKTPDENKDWNVLEWTVDGERYKAECEGDPLFGCDPVDCEYYHDIKSLYITGGSSGEGGMIIYKYRNLKEGTVNYLYKNDYMKFGEAPDDLICREFVCDTNQHYSLFIEQIDTINKIIVGTFSFTGIDNCQDTARVEVGYFKLTYRP